MSLAVTCDISMYCMAMVVSAGTGTRDCVLATGRRLSASDYGILRPGPAGSDNTIRRPILPKSKPSAACEEIAFAELPSSPQTSRVEVGVKLI